MGRTNSWDEGLDEHKTGVGTLDNENTPAVVVVDALYQP